MGARHYGYAVDMWSVGCIFAELLGRRILFQVLISRICQTIHQKTVGSVNDLIYEKTISYTELNMMIVTCASFHSEIRLRHIADLLQSFCCGPIP